MKSITPHKRFERAAACFAFRMESDLQIDLPALQVSIPLKDIYQP